MMNERLIAEAVKIVVDYFEAEGIYEATKTIDARARQWYNHTEDGSLKIILQEVKSWLIKLMRIHV